MRKEERNVLIHGKNSYGQMTTTSETQDYYCGTLDEALELSQSEPVTLRRDTKTEKYFPSWDNDSKYVTISKGNAICYSSKIEPHYTVFIIENKRTIATVENIAYSIVNGISVSLSDRQYVHYIDPEQLKFGGKNCEISTLRKGSKIEFDRDINEKTRNLENVVILSDGIREVDTNGNLVKW